MRAGEGDPFLFPPPLTCRRSLPAARLHLGGHQSGDGVELTQQWKVEVARAELEELLDARHGAVEGVEAVGNTEDGGELLKTRERG